MPSLRDPHPTSEQLVAFGQGRLSADDAAHVEIHLEHCSTCCERMSNVTCDDKLARLARDVHAHREASSVGELSLAATRIEQSSSHTADEINKNWPNSDNRSTAEKSGDERIPVELQNHSRYRVIRILGRGGMGVVWLAEHLMMRRLVALKVIGSKFIADRAAVERFYLEVRAAAKLKHSNIVTAFDAEQAGELHFLVMEYVDGLSLAEYVLQHGPLSIEMACDVIRQTCFGLSHAHRNGMIHRDIKPQNLMLEGGSVVRILDFGLAKLAIPEGPVSQTAKTEVRLTAVGMVLGTPDYMAPEQAIDASSADVRSDIYSLGCTWFFLLTGKAPFEGCSFEQMLAGGVRSRIAALKKLCSESPPRLLRLVERMMAEKLEDRPRSAEDVIRAINEILDSGQKPNTLTPAIPNTQSEQRSVSLEAKAQASADLPGTKVKSRDAEATRSPGRSGAKQSDAHEQRTSLRSQGSRSRPATSGNAENKRRARTQRKPIHKWIAVAGVSVLLILAGVLVANSGVFRANNNAKTDSMSESPQMPLPNPAGSLKSEGTEIADLPAASAVTSLPDSIPARSAQPNDSRQTGRHRILFMVQARDFYWPHVGPLTQLLRDNDCEVVWISWSSTATVLNNPQDTVRNLLLFNDVNPADYDALIISGGEGLIRLTEKNADADEAERITSQMHKDGKPIIALVAGPAVLAKMKLLDGVRATGVPPIHDLVRNEYGVKLTGNNVEVCGQIITGRDNTEQVVRQLVVEILQTLKNGRTR